MKFGEWGGGKDLHLFDLGDIVVTQGVHDLCANEETKIFISKCLERHQAGDGGDLCQVDKVENFQSIMHEEKGRILSSYDKDNLPNGKLWIITEADRSVTTILLPEEY